MAWSLRSRALDQCASCGHQVSLTAGTVFDGTRKPLVLWSRVIGQFLVSKSGCSAAVDVCRQHGLKYEVIIPDTSVSLAKDMRDNGPCGNRRMPCRRGSGSSSMGMTSPTAVELERADLALEEIVSTPAKNAHAQQRRLDPLGAVSTT